MTFKDESKQAEYNAFAAYYRLVAQRPHTSAKMSRLNQLDSIMRGDFPGALQELKSEQRKQVVERTAERKLGKPEGSALTRRGSLPVAKQPQPGTARYERLKAAGLLPSQQQAAQAQSGKSEAVKVVAGDNAKDFTEKLKARTKEIAAVGVTADELATVQLSTGDDFNTDTGRTENNLVSDASELSAKDLVERYGRDLIFEHLFEAGFERDGLEQKTDRQLANTLKKHVNG